MNERRPIHSDFKSPLNLKSQDLIDLYVDLRNYILELAPDSNELLYHTHALTSLYTVSEKMSDGFVMLPIYTSHVNLGFNRGAILKDPQALLKGTGKLIRHIPVNEPSDYRNENVRDLILEALALAYEDLDKPSKSIGMTISKIKK
ncbi:DUF1801 domain-containing protein [Cryomorphaceae bacterium 1068]|nr:DUF1801 domain-containing protein [Cryomorphaceae bacterium 1068]